MKKESYVPIKTKFEEIFRESGLKESKVCEMYEELSGRAMSGAAFREIRNNNRPTTIGELVFLARVFNKTTISDVVDRRKCTFTEL